MKSPFLDTRPSDTCKRRPLSAAQEGIWLGQQLYGRRPLYNTAECVEIHGSLDWELFETSLRQTVSEAETLHLRFDVEEGTPYQYCDRSLPWQLQQLDFSDATQPRQAAWDWMRQNLQQTVNLSHEKPFAQALIRLAPDRHLWYQRIHHAVIDGYGTSMLLRRVSEVYSALSQGQAVTASPFAGLSGVIEEDIAYQTSSQFERDRQYWLDAMQDAPEPVRLTPQTAPASDLALRQSAVLPTETFAQLQEVSRQAQASWADLLLAATAIYLHRCRGATEIILGVPMMGRLGSAALRVPAMVMNIVPLRVSVTTDSSFAQVASQIAQRLRDLRPHQRYRYEQLRRDLKRVGRPLFGPVVNIMPFDDSIRFGDASCTLHNLSAGPVEDLAVNVRANLGSRTLKLDIEANPACYSPEELAQHQQGWLAELHRGLEDCECPLTSHPATQALLQGEPLAEPVPDVLQRFLERAQQQPDAPAIVAADQHWSYGELCQQAQDLGAKLVAFGVQPEQLVAVHLPRSYEAIVAILGVLFSGAAYLALDPEAPTTRNANLLQDAKPVLAIAQTASPLPQLPDLPPQWFLNDLPQLPTATLPKLRCDRLAYVTYTSGSTGQPKGVAIDRQALARFTAAAQQRYDITAADRVLQFAGLHFDASVEEIFTSLCSGATLVLREMAMLQSLPHFLETCDRQQITVLDLPTAFWHELAFYLANHSTLIPPSLRTVIIGGEAALPQRIQQWHAAVGENVTLWNTYGPSETTVVATAAKLTPDVAEAVPIGRPLPGVDVMVTNEGGVPVAPGESGELCVLGATVARGYLGRSQLTAERFVRLESLPQQPRAYRTGDRVYLRPDGQLVFLGRLDAEFKISGHRVDPLEIESLLSAVPGIREAAVIGYSLPEGVKRLCAYLVAAGSPPSIASLRQHLAAILPAAIVPAGFNFVDSLPKTASGKVDRQALRQRSPQWLTRERDDRLPALEALILQAWERVLGQANLTVQDNFFELGGQSLQTIQVTNWLSTQLGCDLPIATIFSHPTASELAAVLRTRVDRDRPPSSPFSPHLPITQGAEPPLFCLHPAAGLSWCYMGLARHLDIPLSGLQSPYLEGERPSLDTPVTEGWPHILQTYLELLQQAQPQGPYRLLGWSFGGVLAHSLAVRLQQQGEVVEQLILLDAYPSHQLQRRDRPSDAEILALLLQATGQKPLSVDRLPSDRDGALALLRQGSLGAQLDGDRLHRLFDITRFNVELARQAPTPEFYSGDLRFFSATRGRRDGELSYRAWQPFVGGDIENHDIDCEHGRLLGAEVLPQIARAIGGRF